MQRRAVAVFATFFLLIGVASYGLIATAEEPTIDLEEAEIQVTEGEEFTIGDQTYTLASLDESEDEDTGEMLFEAELVWQTEEGEMSESLTQEATVTLADDTEYLAFFPGDGSVMLTDDTSEFEEEAATQAAFDNRISGLWWIVATSGIFVFSLVAFAFLPSRY